MPIDEKLKDKIILGRQIVNKYRLDHSELSKEVWSPQRISNQTILVIGLINNISNMCLLSLRDFFINNYIWNIQELGFESIKDFEEKATIEDSKKLNQMWN
jgi:hypothetical protein